MLSRVQFPAERKTALLEALRQAGHILAEETSWPSVCKIAELLLPSAVIRAVREQEVEEEVIQEVEPEDGEDEVVDEQEDDPDPIYVCFSCFLPLVVFVTSVFLIFQTDAGEHFRHLLEEKDPAFLSLVRALERNAGLIVEDSWDPDLERHIGGPFFLHGTPVLLTLLLSLPFFNVFFRYSTFQRRHCCHLDEELFAECYWQVFEPASSDRPVCMSHRALFYFHPFSRLTSIFLP